MAKESVVMVSDSGREIDTSTCKKFIGVVGIQEADLKCHSDIEAKNCKF